MTDGVKDGATQVWRADVLVSLKPVVNDPQGLAIRDGLQMLGYGGVQAVRAGKYIQVWVEAADAASAERAVTEMCQRLLANPVIEQFSFTVTQAAASDAVAAGGE